MPFYLSNAEKEPITPRARNLSIVINFLSERMTSLRVVRESSTRSGGRHRHSPITKLVRVAIENVKKRAKVEHVAAQKAHRETNRARLEVAAEDTARVQKERTDACAIAALLARGQCPIRLKMGSLRMTRNDLMSQKRKRALMRLTCWVFCKRCAKWQNPVGFVTPEEFQRGLRPHCLCIFVGTVPVMPAWNVWTSCQVARSLLHTPPPPPPPPPPPDDNAPHPDDDDPYASWLKDPWQNYLKRRETARLVDPLVNALLAF